MRKVSFAIAVGFVLSACGGGEDAAKPPQAPQTPVATAPTPTETAAPAPAPAPAPQKSLAELQKETMQGLGQAMNARDAKKIASFYTESAVMKHPGAPDVNGRDAIAAHWQKMFDAFSNTKGGVSRVWMKGDVVVTEWAWTGKNTGELMGMKATEKDVGMTGVSVAWFSPEGLIKEEHAYSDGGTMMSQLGVSKQKARPIPTVPSGPPQVFSSNNAADEAKNVEAANKMFAAFEKKSEADFVAGADDKLEWDDMTQPETSKGKEAAKKYFKAMTAAFPDAKTTTTNVWGVGDFVIAEGTFSGTHKGPLFGIPATQKPVTMHALDIIQFKDGKVVKGWSYGNSAEWMMQLGLMKEPGAKKDDKAPAKPAAPAAPAKKDDKAAPAPAPAKK
jgi:steroid delta-isomerase-like uncharacterized protein